MHDYGYEKYTHSINAIDCNPTNREVTLGCSLQNAAVNKTRNLAESQFTTFVHIKQSIRTLRTLLLQ